MNDKHTAYIGLGGNLGDVIASFGTALSSLDNLPGTTVEAVSPVYKSAPWGIEDQPWFHNACSKLITTIEPEKLLADCLAIEKSLHRVRDIRWGPRTIDIDLLLYEGIEMATEGLTLPHPRITERQFVLQPLCDLDPSLIITGKTCKSWIIEKEWPALDTVQLSDNWWH